LSELKQMCGLGNMLSLKCTHGKDAH
jgi:hypothetical protein